jgi:hypothetical protein
VQARALLAKEDRRAQFDADEYGQHGDDRREDQQRGQSDQQVERAFPPRHQ